MGQGTVKKRWGVKFYALAVSVFVHAAALTIFAAVKLTQPKAETANQTAAVVNINRASILAERPAVTAKPKVVSGNRIEAAAKGASILKSQISSFKKIPNPDYQSTNEERSVIAPINDVGAAPEKIGTTESLVINETQGGAKENAGKMPATQVEFFDSPASGRRICYVVDCSGSK